MNVIYHFFKEDACIAVHDPDRFRYFVDPTKPVLVDYWHFELGQGPALLEDLVVNNASAVVIVESIYRFSLDILDFFRVFWHHSHFFIHLYERMRPRRKVSTLKFILCCLAA